MDAQYEKRRAYYRAYYARNRDKYLTYGRTYANKHRERINAYSKQYKKTHRDIHEVERLTLLAGRPPSALCEICNNPSKEKTRTSFDHCHKTGKFRGWLCQRCNRALGFVGDSTELLEKMIEYLKKNQ